MAWNLLGLADQYARWIKFPLDPGLPETRITAEGTPGLLLLTVDRIGRLRRCVITGPGYLSPQLEHKKASERLCA